MNNHKFVAYHSLDEKSLLELLDEMRFDVTLTRKRNRNCGEINQKVFSGIANSKIVLSANNWYVPLHTRCTRLNYWSIF